MTQIVGIVNLTPDSFSGDGTHYSPQKALKKIDAFIRDGAGVVDIGAESTRPGASLLSPGEEWQRFAPLMAALQERADKVAFSVDTRHPETAEEFLRHFSGKHSPFFINCVSSTPDNAIFEVAKKYNATPIIMHSVTVPADPKITIPEDEDVMETLHDWATRAIRQHGTHIILDPGIGFGKTAQQSLTILRNIAQLTSLGVKVLVGHSRKSFLSLFTDKKPEERDPETLVISEHLIKAGVAFLRVHDVKSHVALLRIREAL